MYSAYTDGGCSGNPGPGGWGYCILEDGKMIASSSGGERLTTNNRMELTAVIELLKFAVSNNLGSINICTDSQYVKNGITAWIGNWKKKNWRTASGDPVKNREYWEELEELAERLDVRWTWVKGHAGIEWNEFCDDLTQKEIARFK